MTNPLSSIKTTLHRHRKQLIVSGLLYGVLWSVILFFTWPEAPQFITWLDLISGIILIFLAQQVFTGQHGYINNSILMQSLELASLVYAIIWTFIIMIFIEIDIGELLLPLDAISLYALTLLLVKIWQGDTTPI